MYLLYMYETFTEPTRINLPPEQTQTKPQVSLGLLLENLPQLRVNLGPLGGLPWVYFGFAFGVHIMHSSVKQTFFVFNCG